MYWSTATVCSSSVCLVRTPALAFRMRSTPCSSGSVRLRPALRAHDNTHVNAARPPPPRVTYPVPPPVPRYPVGRIQFHIPRPMSNFGKYSCLRFSAQQRTVHRCTRVFGHNERKRMCAHCSHAMVKF